MGVRAISIEACLAPEAEPLRRAHWQEIEPARQPDALLPNGAVYRGLEAQGALVVLGAFHAEKLVGYSITLLVPALHADRLQATNDALYLEPAHRGGQLGLALIRGTERVVRERGAAELFWSARIGSTFDHLLPRLGYRSEFITHRKDL